MSTTCNLAALGSICLAVAGLPALAADVTTQRLLDPAAEPQNWLMVHRDYDNSRHSPLKDVNRENVKDLKLKFIFSIGGRSTGGTLPGKEESSPLVDDGFMYVSDTYDRVMKFDVRSGRVVAGPASTKIETYKAEVRNGEVYVSPSRTVTTEQKPAQK